MAYDVIVVGAGSAGNLSTVVVATRIAEALAYRV
jgi:ribulose 1,5-bisphosphate synthetase/thiazole synthase